MLMKQSDKSWEDYYGLRNLRLMSINTRIINLPSQSASVSFLHLYCVIVDSGVPMGLWKS